MSDNHVIGQPLCNLCGKNPADRFAGTYCHSCFREFELENQHGESPVPEGHMWAKLREERVAYFAARAALQLPLFDDVPIHLYLLPPEVERSLVKEVRRVPALTTVRMPKRHSARSPRKNSGSKD
jgi:hypothetical protein